MKKLKRNLKDREAEDIMDTLEKLKSSLEEHFQDKQLCVPYKVRKGLYGSLSIGSLIAHCEHCIKILK